MNVRELMEYVESEYIIINNTPCELCGGTYITEGNGFNFENGVPTNVTQCVCEQCGNRKEFSFMAPFSGPNSGDVKKELN